MNQAADISKQLEEYLPPQVFKLIKNAGDEASRLGQTAYLVGGIVRDLLLGHSSFDIDLVVEGDAIKLARELIKFDQVKLLTHPRFGTAKINYPDFSIDIATARLESYSQAGALPTVQPGTITDDLSRRDFTINAMALYLTPQRFGELIDLYHGKDDLKHHLIRILYPNSFVDDATRILRALRYEQRLGFRLEKETGELLCSHVSMLNTISNDRIRRELELILKEGQPEQILRRAEGLKVLQQLHPSLKGNGWISQKFNEARQTQKQTSVHPLYLCLLIYNLTNEENEQFLSRFNFPNKLAQAIRHTLILKAHLPVLSKADLKPSDIYHQLKTYVPQAIQANALASESPEISQRLELYLAKLRYVKPVSSGEDLKRMGVPSGPQLGQVLKTIHEAKLNGEVQTRKDEERLVHDWGHTL